MDTLGSRLKNLRTQKGFTQEEVAKVLGVDRSTVASWEVGRREPDYTTLFRLIELYGSSIDYVFGQGNEAEQKDMLTSSNIPADIKDFIFIRENQDLIRAIKEMQTRGYPNKIILDWLSSLKNTVDTLKQQRYPERSGEVLWLEENLLPENHRKKYSAEQKRAIADKVKEILADPGFVPPWDNKK